MKYLAISKWLHNVSAQKNNNNLLFSELYTLTRICHLLIILMNLLFGSSNANSLTNQQINLLLENDDVQMFTPHSKVKKVTLSIEQSSDHQGKTIAEYSEAGLLINYYQVVVAKAENSKLINPRDTMITTLINVDEGKWQRKQTLGKLEIDNSIYTLKNDHITMTSSPSDLYHKQRKLKQNIFPSNRQSGTLVHFSYLSPPENEQLNIDYRFNQNQLLSDYHFFVIDENGDKTQVKLYFQYDKQLRLIHCNEEDDYQPHNQAPEKYLSYINYYDFDPLGNWQTKVEKIHSQTVIYRRMIEYW